MLRSQFLVWDSIAKEEKLMSSNSTNASSTHKKVWKIASRFQNTLGAFKLTNQKYCIGAVTWAVGKTKNTRFQQA